MLDGLLDAVQRAGVHGRLPGGGLGLRLEPHLKEGGNERDEGGGEGRGCADG